MKYIPEHYQVSAVPVNGGERISGYYVKITGRKTIHLIYTGYAEFDCAEFFPDKLEVDPDTIEPVRAEIILHDNSYDKDGDLLLGFCPNCKLNIGLHGGYCYMCGQALEVDGR